MIEYKAKHQPESKSANYKLRLNNFEGPLDLLLYLIQKEEIDICKIEIAKITKQYLYYLDLMQRMDLEIASEFLIMASILIRLKSKSLIPIFTNSPSEELEEIRSKEDLIKKLIEYKKFKEAANFFDELIDEQEKYFPIKPMVNEEIDNIEFEYKNPTILDIVKAFHSIINAYQKRINWHEISLDNVKIEDKIDLIKSELTKKNKINFIDLFDLEKLNKTQIVVTFMAILELAKMNFIKIYQNFNFDNIIIEKTELVS